MLSRSLIYSMSLFMVSMGIPMTLSAQTPAEAGLRLVTSPLPISLVAEPGTTISTPLKIKNAGLSEEKLKIDILKFNAYEDSGKPALMDLESTDTFDDWVSFSEPTFAIAPEEWKTITATFTVPPEASFGYYYAFVFTRDTPETDLAPKQTAVVGGTATLVLLEARVPDAKREVAVVEFSTDKTMYEFLPTRFTIALKNTGNVHVAPRGNIFLKEWSGKEIALLEVNEAKGNILPNSTRLFESDWTDGFPVYQVKVENGATVLDEAGNPTLDLTWNWQDASKLRFGKYTAKLLLIYDDGTRDIPIEGVVSFWVVPWRILVGALFIGFFFFIGLRSSIMKLWRKIFASPTTASPQV
jgi:hypothetical protein